MINTVLNDRYQLEGELGRGGMGVVYRAHDTLLEREVAVKLVRTSALGSQGRSRLLQEAQAAASLNHPNIVAVYDAGLAEASREGDASAYIVMELVTGLPLSDYKPSDLMEAATIGRQIALALEAAHGKGIIHRDLKPGNVIVAPRATAAEADVDVQVKLMDFGLARITGRTRLTQEGTFMGTISYIAPEVIQGQPATPRSDLYSLGILLYELVAGRPPFEGETITAILSQHLHAPVTPPSVHNERIPGELDDLIVRLLHKEAAKRPASAAMVAQTLGALLQAPEAAKPAVVDPLKRLVRGRLVGRERELAEAQALWQQASAAQGQILLISGEPGIGKTRLVRELTTLAKASGGRALIGAAYPETGAPYAPFAQIVQQALRADPDGLTLPGFVMAEMLELAPGMRLDYPELAPNPPLDARAGQRRLLDSVALFAQAICQEQPLLLVLEDAHWADDGTLALMRHLARHGRQQALLLVATYREAELDQNLPFSQVLLDLQRERLAGHIELTRLDRRDTERLLRHLFAQEITPDFLEGIYRKTEGIPFFIEEVCKALVESGDLYFEDGVWHRPVMDRLAIPQSVRAIIQSRLGVLPERVQDILRLAAILGREFDFDTLAAAGRWNEDTLIDALERAEQAQLIAEVSSARGATFAFAHALIPSTLIEEVSGLRQRRLQRQVAQVIEELRPHDWAALAYHYRLARDGDKARTYLRLAGDQARDRFAHEDALRFYSQALTFTHDDAERFDLSLARVTMLHLTANREAEWAGIEELFELANDDTQRIDALLAQANHFITTQHIKAREPASRAATLARQLEDPVREARALQLAGEAANFGASYQQSRQDLEAAATRFQTAGLSADAAASLRALSMALRALGELEAGRAAVEEALALSRQAGSKLQEATSLRRLAIFHNLAGTHEDALPYAQEALALHRQLGDRGEEVHALNVLGITHAGLGDSERGLAYIQESLTLAEAIDSIKGIENATCNIYAHLTHTGDYEEAVNYTNVQLARFREHSDKWLVGHLYIWNAGARRFIGDRLGVLAALERHLEYLEGLQPPNERAWILTWLASIQAEIGRVDQAEQSLRAAEKLVATLPEELGKAGIRQVRAQMHLLQNKDLSAALIDANQAVAYYQQTGAIFDQIWILNTKARLHLALDQPQEALATVDTLLKLMNLEGPVDLRFWPQQSWFTKYQVLRALGRDSEADAALGKAYDWIQQVAEKTQDAELRRCWLEQVPDNPRILAEVEARGLT